MLHLPILLFLLLVLAGSLPAFSNTCCYPASFEPSPPYTHFGCVCVTVDGSGSRLTFVYDPSDPHFDDDYSSCSSMFDSCNNANVFCQVSDAGSFECSVSFVGDIPFPPQFSCSSFPCYFDLGGSGSGSGSGSVCQSVNNLIDTFKGVKEGFLKVFIGSSFAFGLLGGAYAVLRVVF
jgi:hypothetical protein